MALYCNVNELGTKCVKAIGSEFKKKADAMVGFTKIPGGIIKNKNKKLFNKPWFPLYFFLITVSGGNKKLLYHTEAANKYTGQLETKAHEPFASSTARGILNDMSL